MKPGSGAEAGGHQALARFLERVRKSFSHDLRTPLSTIVNYASVLEATHGEGAEEVRDLGRRIRSNALRAARMIQLVANATGLASRALDPTPTDLAALARSVLADTGGRAEVRLAADTAHACTVDAEILGYAWRAYIAVEVDAAGAAVNEVELDVGTGGSVELRCGSGSASRVASDLSNYLRHNGGASRLETSLGLSLAKELVEAHGGELAVAGRPAAGSSLRIRLPAGP